MGALLSVTRLVSLAVTIAVSVARIVVALVLLPFRIIGRLLGILFQLGSALVGLFQNARTSLLYFVIGAAVLALGLVAVYETSIVLNAIDVLYECFFAPLFELIYKFVINTLYGIYLIVSAAYNTILEYVIAKGRLLYADALDVVNCILETGDVFRALSLPAILWEFTYNLFYIFSQEARLARRDPMMAANFYYPNIMPVLNPYGLFLTPGQLGNPELSNAKDQLPGSGAFGPAEPVDPSSANSYTKMIVRNIWNEIVYIVGETGTLATQVVADIQQPAGRFMTSLILRVDVQQSYLRRVSNIVAHTVSLLVGTPFYPLSPNPTAAAQGYSKLRHDVDQLLARVSRIFAKIVRILLIVINDATTYRRPRRVFDGCEPVDATLNFEERFTGFPVIDGFLIIARNGGLSGLTLNIFRSNYELCRLHALHYHFWLDMNYFNTLNLNDVSVARNAYTDHGAQCGFLTANTFVPTTSPFYDSGGITFPEMANYDANTLMKCFNCDPTIDDFWNVACPLWAGTSTPLTEERIDYLHLVFEPLIDFIALFQDPLGVDDEIDGDTLRAAYVAECFIDHFIHSIIYVVDVAAASEFQGVCVEASYMQFLNLGIEPCIIRLLDQVALPIKYVKSGGQTVGVISQCRYVIRSPAESDDDDDEFLMLDPDYTFGARKNNFILCLIAKLAIFQEGFFQDICNFLITDYGIFGPLEDLECEVFPDYRKRNAPPLTVDEDTEQQREKLSTLRHVFLATFVRAMQFAGEVRASQPAIDHCILDDDSPLANCATECALSPCVSAVVDCVAEHLDPKTGLSYAFNAQRNVTERTLHTFALGYDFIAGCEDGELREAAHWSVAIMTMARDMFARLSLFANDFVPAYEECMQMAEELRSSGRSAAEVELAYLNCIGAPVPTSAEANNATVEEADTERDYFRESLRASGVDEKDGVCGALLLDRGFLVDQRVGSNVNELPLNALYRLCGTLHAVGARATSSGAASMPLESYMSLHSAPLAFTTSTARIDVPRMAARDGQFALPSKMPRLFSELPPPHPSFYAPPPPPGTKASARTRERAEHLVSMLRTAVTQYATLFEFGNYLADLYDRMRAGTPARELDQYEKERRAEAFQLILDVHDAPEKAQRRMDEAYQKATTETEMPVRVNSAFVVDLMRSAVGWRGRTERGVHYEVELRPSKGNGRPMDYFVRLQDDDESGMALAPANRPSQWSLVRGEALVAILNGTMHNHIDRSADPSLMQSAHQAMMLLGAEPERAQETYDGIVKVGRAGRSILSAVFRIVNRRLRLQSLPPVQAAIMTLETLVNGNVDEMEAWSSGELGYIVGTGFVPMHHYDAYMRDEQALREDALSLYSTHLSEEGIHSAPLFSRRYVERRHKAKMLALENGEMPPANAGARLFERISRRARNRRHTHVSRSRFYLQHGLEHSDEHIDKFLPLHHPLLAAARRATGVYERAALHAMMASNSEIADDPVVMFLQMILDFLGIDYCIADALDDLQELGERLWQTVYNEFSNFDQKFDDFIERNMCEGPEAYRLNGSETYSIGCIPFLPEDAFEWLKPFPGALRNPPLPSENSDLDNLFRVLIGPGYILWPDEMIEEDCPVERAPEDQCAIPPPFLWAPYIDAEPGERPPLSAETINAVVCLTDFCPVYGDSNPEDFPLCPVCDYCVRDYFSAFEFGFDDGFDVLAVYFRLYRAFVDLLFNWPTNGSGLTCGFLFYPFLVYILLPYLPLAAYIRIALLLMPAIDAFYFLRPERLFFTLYPLFALYEALPFVAIGIWLAALAPCYADVITGQPYDQSNVILFLQWFAPDYLLLQLLEWLQSLTFLARFFDLTTFDTVIDSLRANVEAAVPTVAESIYAILSVALAVLTIVGIVVAFIILYNLLTIIGPVFDAIATILSALLDIVRAVSDYLLRARVRALVDDVEDLTDDALVRDLQQDRRIDEIEEELIKDERDDAQLRRRVQAIGRYGN